MPNRLYGEEEIGRVLRRAAELQEHESADEPHGLTRAELEELAAEVGIDPAYVHRALAELEQTPDESPTSKPLWGAPQHLELERVIDGPLTDERWMQLVEALRSFYKTTGHAGQVGTSREWIQSRSEGNAKIHVTASPRGQQTKLHIRRSLNEEIGGTYGLLLSFGAMMSMLPTAMLIEQGLHPIFAVVLGVSLFAAFFFLTRFIVSKTAAAQRRKMKEIMAQMEQILAPPDAAESHPAPSSHRLDDVLHAPDAVPDATPAASKRRTRS